MAGEEVNEEGEDKFGKARCDEVVEPIPGELEVQLACKQTVSNVMRKRSESRLASTHLSFAGSFRQTRQAGRVCRAGPRSLVIARIELRGGRREWCHVRTEWTSSGLSSSAASVRTVVRRGRSV